MKRTLEKTEGCDDDELKYIPLTEKSWVRTFHYSGEKVNPAKFDKLWDLHPPECAQIMMMGKLIYVPRWQQTFGSVGYHFSGVKHTAMPITPLLQPFLDYANKVCAPYLKSYKKKEFNMMFLNWYQDGSNYIGWHADDEKQLLKNDKGETLVFSISFGATRRFQLRLESDKKKITEFNLSHGNALLMGGQCQSTHKHRVPKIEGKKGKDIGRRINMTFRIFK